MKIEHLAIWSSNIEQLADFYIRYFDGKKGARYHNPKKGFSSYFVSFEEGCRLEIMHREDIPTSTNDPIVQATGITHFAFELGSESAVNDKTEQLREAGYQVVDGPRTTGDGYYESVILDPEGNRLELACVAGE
ncbi:MAG: VOC family protein [Bacteroidota bacterium]